MLVSQSQGEGGRVLIHSWIIEGDEVGQACRPTFGASVLAKHAQAGAPVLLVGLSLTLGELVSKYKT